MCVFAPYDIENAEVEGYDVVVNRPKVAAYRAPGAPISEFAAEGVVDEIAKKLGIDPAEFRLMNAAKEGTKCALRARSSALSVASRRSRPHATASTTAPARPQPGSRHRVPASGSTSAASPAPPSTSTRTARRRVIEGNPDIGGSRASIQLAGGGSELGIDRRRGAPLVADTDTIGYTFLTGGSRVTFATGMAAIDAAGKVVEQLRERAAKIWDIPVDGGEWEDGHAKPSGSNAGDFEPLSLADIAAQAGKTGGPIAATASVNAQGAGPGFGTHVCDVEVDRETGRVTVLRYTAVQDAGKAVHPSATSRARSRAAPPRASAGRSTRSTSTTSTAGSRIRASSTTACRWPRTCR